MATDRNAKVTWRGSLMDGSGTIEGVGSGAFGPLDVTWVSRADTPDGRTSPEELIAAAWAACYSMALYHALAGASPRVRVLIAPEKSEEGREQMLVLVSDEANLAKLDRYKEITAKLGDPRKLRESRNYHAIGFALLTGCTIAAYTLVDKIAVAAFLIPPLIQDWAANLGRVTLMTPLALR